MVKHWAYLEHARATSCLLVYQTCKMHVRCSTKPAKLHILHEPLAASSRRRCNLIFGRCCNCLVSQMPYVLWCSVYQRPAISPRLPLQANDQRVTDPTVAAAFSWSSNSSDASIRAHALACANRFGDVKSATLKKDSRGATYVILAFRCSSDAGALIAQRQMDPLDCRKPTIRAWTGNPIQAPGQPLWYPSQCTS